MTANDTKIEIKQPVTLEEISAKIGISRTTIYKVLNHKGEVSDKTRRIILEENRSEDGPYDQRESRIGHIVQNPAQLGA